MRLIYGIIIVCCLCLFMLMDRGCKRQEQIRPNIDTMQLKVDKYKAEIDSIKSEYITLLNSRTVKIKTLREIRTKYVHDTFTVETLINDSAKIAALLEENKIMNAIIYDDSLIIANQSYIVLKQDSVITHLEAITATQKQLMDDCATEVKKQRKKMSFWKTVAIALGIIAVAK